MVGWTNNSRWRDIDIFNLLGLDPLTTNLSWAVIDKRPRQINLKLKPNDPTVVLPEGVSVSLINAFRSDIFDLLHPMKEGADGRLFQTDPTIESMRAVADVLEKINNTKLINYQKTWDPEIGVPGNWLGLEPRVGDTSAGHGHGVAGYSTQATAAISNTEVTTASELSMSANTVIVLTEEGTPDDPITLDDNVPTTNPGNAIVPLHQQERYMQLVLGSPQNFVYVMAPSRLRALAQRFTKNNKGAIVIGMVRRPDWDAAQTFPEYICVAALHSNSMTIRVYRKSLEGHDLPAWPGGGTVFVSMDDIKRRGYLFRTFHEFNKERIKRYLLRLREKDALPRIRSGALVACS